MTPRSTSVVSSELAGAGVPGGQVIGSSDRPGAYPSSRALRPQGLASTLHHLLGIDPHAEFKNTLGWPGAVMSGGSMIPEIGNA